MILFALFLRNACTTSAWRSVNMRDSSFCRGVVDGSGGGEALAGNDEGAARDSEPDGLDTDFNAHRGGDEAARAMLDRPESLGEGRRHRRG